MMITADLDDLLLEQWLRRRQNKQIVWVTKNNKVIPIQDMSDSHLNNAINMIDRNNEYEFLI